VLHVGELAELLAFLPCLMNKECQAAAVQMKNVLKSFDLAFEDARVRRLSERLAMVTRRPTRSISG
jgi:hypothetical protein